MKLKPTRYAGRGFAADRVLQRSGGFTLAEVLAALLFMSIVIPVTVQGVRVASQAGQVGERRSAAARLADRLLSEMLATGTVQSGSRSGNLVESGRQYRWVLQSEAWNQESMTQYTMRVYFQVQGVEYDASLSTLVDPAKLSQMGSSVGGGS